MESINEPLLDNENRRCSIKCSCCSAIKIMMILYEILDKTVDIATAVVYYKGRFDSRKESVYEALLAFVIIGCIISTARIFLYIWGIILMYKNDESQDKRYDDLELGMHAVKVVFEAFPQSVLANFFVHFPKKKYGWGIKTLDPTVDSFCGAPFIFLWISLLWYYCCKYPCKCDNNTEWKKVCVATSLSITVVISVVGFVFAVLSLVESANRCS